MNINQLIYYATLAPSGQNTQPWKFSAEENTVRIYPDFDRTLPVVDSDNHALYISLGCALENLVISAKQDGHASRVDYFPEDENDECLRVTLTEENPRKETELFEAIPVRQSNRSMYDRHRIPDEDIDKLLRASEYETVALKTLDTQGKEVETIIELVKEAGRTFQRIALKATSLGIVHAHLNMPCEVESVRKKLSNHLGLNPDEQSLLLRRMGYAAEVPRSIRRPIDEVLIKGADK